MVNPLFVLLDDNEILRGHLVSVSEWMIMSVYSTWLFFIRENTLIESYFKDVYVSIDSTFLVSQKSIAPSKEVIKCIYRVEIADLQIKSFASWTQGTGLSEMTDVSDHKAKNFHGKIVKIGFYDVSPVLFNPLFRFAGTLSRSLSSIHSLIYFISFQFLVNF